jgi:phosphoribosylformylglycinamidine synthase
MADKGGVGITLNLDLVPQRETGMTAYEMMLSESQERMLMVLKPGAEAEAAAIFKKWDLDFAVIGQTTDTGRMIVTHKGKCEADIPVATLANSAPLYERPWFPLTPPKLILPEWVPAPNAILETLVTLMGGPALSSRRWIWEQYDHMVMGDTVQRPGGDAAVVRVHGTDKGLALTCDVTPRYVAADPVMGTKQAVVETWRNLTAVGADPLAITDNLNFGNPERPEVMGQFVGAIKGMGEACRVLDYPVVSGNVSLYNETNGVGIPPTPAIGGVGLIPDVARMADLRLKQEGDLLIVIGREAGHLGQSLYQELVTGELEGAPPPVDLADEIKAGRLVRALIREGKVSAVHDVSDGGLLVAIAEMALAGSLGVELFSYEGKLPVHAVWFGEDQGRYVLSVDPMRAEEVLERARLLALPARIVGRTGGEAIALKGEAPLALIELRSAHEAWLPRFMAA